MTEAHHRAIGREAGRIRHKLQERINRRGLLTQKDVADCSWRVVDKDNQLTRQLVIDIEKGSARAVSVAAVMRYLEVLRAIAAGRVHKIPAQPDIVEELDHLSSALRKQASVPATFVTEIRAQSLKSTRSIATCVQIPERYFEPSRSPPAALLQPQYRIVPFHGRQRELEDLSDWCADPEPTAVRLYVGAGGMGKTRLLIEHAKILEKSGWIAGFLGASLHNFWIETRDFWQLPSPIFVIVDYAENRCDDLVRLFESLQETQRSSSSRIVLLVYCDRLVRN